MAQRRRSRRPGENLRRSCRPRAAYGEPSVTSRNQSIVQMCFIIADLDAAMASWIETIGAGPFFAQKNLNVPTEYRGKPSFIDVSAAFGQAGAMQVELIEVHGDNPSVYRDMY